MPLDRSAARTRPSQGEAPFDVGEVFYSRTDPRGVILAANEIFRRVSDYDWDRIIGAPHRLIRHPEMPRGVFRLMWDRIQAGKPTGAYVRNLAQDGLHYWVYAVVTPIDGGYLSVRIRPTSKLFATVRKEYAALLEREAQGLDPVASAAALTARIGEIGFADYDEFMASALTAELTAEPRVEVRRLSPQLGPIAEIMQTLRKVLDEKHQLHRGFEDIRAIPMNLHIAASRIETYGGPVATLAENYRIMAAEVTRKLEVIVGTGKGDGLGEAMLRSVASAMFRVGSAQVQGEVVRDSRAFWPAESPVDRQAEIEVLEVLARRYEAEAEAGLAAVGRSSGELMDCCEELKRQMLGLDSIRVLCRVEAGRLNLAGSSLSSIIGQLDSFHAEIGNRLDRILGLAIAIRTSAEHALRLTEEVWAAIGLRSVHRPQTPAPLQEQPGTSP